MELIDSHCHLDAAEFDSDRGQVLVRARSAGVTRLLVPATAAAGWPKLRQVCADAPGLYPAYGLHPVFLAEHRPQHLDALGQWIERERPLAIGECGLDHFVDGLDRQAQAFYFEGQLRLAGDTGLPLVVHARRAVDATIAAIRRIGSSSGLRPQLGADAALKLDCGAGLGAATHITGAFAFAAAGKALEMLLKPKKAAG